MRSVKCTNTETGASITISENSFAPLFLAGLEGVYSASNNVTITDNTMIDGGTYQGSIANVRNIVITAIDQPNNVYNQENRDLIYTIFRKGTRGEFVYNEDDKKPRKIPYYVESVTRDDGGHRPFTISLLCPNPMFSDLTDSVEYMADWVGDFEFIHEFQADGEELGYRLLERKINIVNTSAANSIGFAATITTTGTVLNPVLSRVESSEHIRVGSESNPFTLSAGDVLLITTQTNNKHVKVKRSDSLEFVECNEYLTGDSEFFQLLYGNNNIVYSADSGESYMTIEIKYAFEYEGA